MSKAYHANDEPDWVNEDNEDVEIGDLSEVRSVDIMERFRKVPFDIIKADLDVQKYKTDSGEEIWAKKSLKLQVAVSATGVDGEGKYANKRFFPQILLTVNREQFPESFKYDKYDPKTGKAFLPLKQFLSAMGYDPKEPPTISREFRESLLGGGFIADIAKREKRVQVDGQWQGSGEFENPLENFTARDE